MKVLVVDDNKDLAELIQGVLEGEGVEVMSANDGIQGYANFLLFQARYCHYGHSDAGRNRL